MQVCPACGEENPPRFRLCGFCGAQLALALPPQEVRKTVTVVFSDLRGSTSLGEQLDSESLREVMTRYFDEMRAVLEAHGGTIEKFIGDAVMAVFGLPRVHEDDALRAVRAAAETRTALASLNEELERQYGVRLANRTGVNTGEVVSGDATTGQRLVTGDTVNVAARLEQAAPELEVLIGEPTYRLVRDAVEVEQVEPLELKGKAERVPAYRLLSVVGQAQVGRTPEGVLVGRDQELAALSSAFEETAAGACRVATVFGEPGVGKSRLTEELLQSVDGNTRVLRGRCLPYGRGITFWPLVEVVREAASIHEADPPELAREKLAALAPDAADVVLRVASAVGLVEEEFALDEIFWGTRKLLEQLAGERPLTLFVDDVHWAEDAFLDLLEHLSASAEAPIFVLCASRPELLERRPGWSEGKLRVELEPLSKEEAGQVIEHLLGAERLADDVRQRIVDAAEGNPLFVEQLLSMLLEEQLVEKENGVWEATTELDQLAVPGTIQALLAARLEVLDPEERAVLEPAAVIGAVFMTEAVEELAPEAVRESIGRILGTLVEKRLIRPAPEFVEEDRYRFHHILIRDTAYQALLKRTRATLHEQFADWTERVNRERDRDLEYEEILGYHLEQSYGYLAELGPLDDHGRAVGERGAARLVSAGRRAFGRGDMGASANLLRRAAEMLDERAPTRLELLPDLGEAMMEIGEFAWAEVYLEEALAATEKSGDERLHADAVLTRLFVRYHAADFGDWREEVERETERLVPLLQAQGADAELAKAWRLLALVHASECRWEQTAGAQQKSIQHARAAGLRRQEARTTAAYTMSLSDGPTPVPEAIEGCEEIVRAGFGDIQSEAVVLCSLSTLLALDGSFAHARELYRNARRLREDLGATVLAAATSLTSSRVEFLANEPAAAEVDLRRDDATLAAMGERYLRPLVLASLAQAAYLQGNLDEAGELAETAGELAAEDDVESQALWRSVQAKVLARRSEGAEAERLARAAIEALGSSDAPLMRVDALVDLAEVLQGRAPGDVRAALAEALELCRLKQMAVPTGRVEALLDALGADAEPIPPPALTG
jgi:class 3 adenylate cyclase/type II secretory pathway predicted ATPase ExeA